MQLHTTGIGPVLPAIVIAALGILQPGIDPVFLALLSQAHGLAPAFHGWIVSATQAGLAAGSLASLLTGARLPRACLPLAALVALATALATAWSGTFAVLIALRATFGIAMGVIYTQAMAHAARHLPNGAFAAVLLLQLILSMIVALGLPALAEQTDAHLALALLAAAPFLTLLILLLTPDPLGQREELHDRISTAHQGPVERPHARASLSGRPIGLIAAAIFFYVCATMIVWSLTGAMALAEGFGNATLGTAVSLGSLAGALTALAVFRERIVIPPQLTSLACGLALLAPMAAAPTGSPALFILAIAVFNVGTTAIVIRFSGFAAAASRSANSLRFVSCLQTLGMIAGPAIGSLVTMLAGSHGPELAATTMIGLGMATFAAWHRREQRGEHRNVQPASHDLAPASSTMEPRRAA